MGDVHHLFGQLGNLTALEGHEVLELLAGGAVLVVVVALVHDELGTELIAHFLLELLQDVGGHTGGIAVPIHVFLPLQLIEDQSELMEEGGVADHVDIGVIGDELAQPLHGELVGLGLAHVKGDLVLEVGPAVGHGVVHVDGVPDQVSQESHGVVMVGLGLDGNIAVGIAPLVGGDHFTGGAVHHFPPALDVVPGVYLHQLGADALHQGDGDAVAGGGVEAGHNVALLHLVGIGLGPGVVLTGGVVGGVDLGVSVFQFLGELGTVAVTDGVGAPFLQNFQSFGDHVHVGGDGYAAFLQNVAHRFGPPGDSISLQCRPDEVQFILYRVCYTGIAALKYQPDQSAAHPVQ